LHKFPHKGARKGIREGKKLVLIERERKGDGLKHLGGQMGIEGGGGTPLDSRPKSRDKKKNTKQREDKKKGTSICPGWENLKVGRTYFFSKCEGGAKKKNLAHIKNVYWM